MAVVYYDNLFLEKSAARLAGHPMEQFDGAAPPAPAPPSAVHRDDAE
jgi:hypothetical protein